MKKSLEEIQYKDAGFSMDHLFKSKSEKVFVLSLKPNQTMPVHKHPGHNLYLLGYGGEGSFLINGETHTCKQGDVFSVGPDDEFGVNNDSNDNFRVFAIMSKMD